MNLSEIIIERIRAEGPISFHDFMEMALYYPELGYYASSKSKIGKEGDYYTSSSVSQLFGEMIGRQLEEMWNLTGIKPFTIVEYGAGNGTLCHDILDYLKHNQQLYNEVHYSIIEKSAVLRETQKLHLREKVSWYHSIDEIPDLNGCVLSNEVVDNFSVHRVVMEDELMEVFVDYRNNDFVELLAPTAQKLQNYIADLNIVFPRGLQTEINLQATNWIGAIAGSLRKGYVITIDYGGTSSELYCKRRSEGTLLCYNKHHINDLPYNEIGLQDITSHVNFSALNHWGLKSGLKCCGFTNQANFLLGLGLKDSLRKAAEQEEDILRAVMKEAALTRTLLLDMGMKFRVLIQSKGSVPQNLSGLRLPMYSLDTAENPDDGKIIKGAESPPSQFYHQI